ncbi:class I SAM-dependent methyltransferase [Merismopedia glauca]|nr:class I SAM-dependent methyltransferase [Merismopedia glauca]
MPTDLPELLFPKKSQPDIESFPCGLGKQLQLTIKQVCGSLPITKHEIKLELKVSKNPSLIMSNKSIGLDSKLYNYLLSVSLREPEILQQLRQETANHPYANMQIAPEQGQFMALLVQLLGAKKTIEVGTFTGYSALAVALALPPNGQVIACDVSAEFTAIARRYWQLAGVDGKIDLRLAPALETLDELLANELAGSFDFAFIDADKENYQAYYERCLKLVRVGGLIAVDNVLWDGQVADNNIQDSSTISIRDFNYQLHNDRRVTISLIPIADGLTLALKH